MPDKDVFDRKLAKGWRNVARCIHHGVDPKDVANRARLALQRYLKALNGLPGCEQFYNSLVDSTLSSRADALNVFDKARSFERVSDDRDLACKLREACLQIYIEMTNGRNHSNGRNDVGNALPSKRDFVKKVLESILDWRLHGKVDMIERISQNGGHWSDSSWRQAYCQEIDRHLERIAETLERDPNFNKPPSVPRNHRVRQTTEELMHAPLELMEE